MPVIGVPRDRLVKIVEPTNTLRPGQIVQGEILKIYPNHRAELQIGSQKMIAQLEAPLAVGERYHFQVVNTTDMIELKVIGARLKGESIENITQLLNQLNIKSTRSTLQFVQTLINDKIPFTKNELQQAIQLLQRANGTNDAQRILFEMIGRNLPLTESVFNALSVKSMTNITQEFTNLLNELQSNRVANETQAKLVTQLTKLMNNDSMTTHRLVQTLQQYLTGFNIASIVSELSQNRDTVLSNMRHLLSQFPESPTSFTPSHVERVKATMNQQSVPAGIKQALITLLENNRNTFLNVVRNLTIPSTFDELHSFINNESIKQQFLSHVNQFTQQSGLTYEHVAEQSIFHQQGQNIEQILTNFVSKKSHLQQQATLFINRWSHLIDDHSVQTLNQAQLAQFKQEVHEQVLRFLPKEQRQTLLNLLQNNESVDRVWQYIHSLSRSETFEQISTVLTNVKDNKFNLTPNMLNQLTDVKTLLQSIHIPTESANMRETSEQLQQTIKGLLLQFVQQNDSSLGERAQQTLHFINGLQLHSVHETSHFIQASIQVPGESIGLNGDLFMEFESRRTEDGKIDPDYCRILFFLNLNVLDDTVIDMHIQKRFVTLTIYNEHKQIENIARPLYNPLRKGLEKLDYQLSAVRFKDLLEQEIQVDHKQSEIYEGEENKLGGVDFRL